MREWQDYTRRDGVLFSEIVLPEGVDPKFADRATLWNAAEKAETRSNARTAREIIFALPHELSEADRLTLARDFADTVCRRYGVGIEFSLHAPDREGDLRNHHCHLMMTTRRLTAEGFGEKTRELDDRRLGRLEIHMLRLLWREHANDALERAGSDERIDERSYEDRELDIVPTKHLGPFASGLERMGRASEIGDHNREAEADPLGRVLEQVTRTRSVFSSADLAVALFNRELDPALRHQLLDDPEVLRLHDRESGRALDLYTTRTIRAQETRIMAAASGMAMDSRHEVSEETISVAAVAAGLSAEQEAALRHATAAGGVKIIEGRAGTGKSHTIQATREAFERDGYRVIGLAPTNVVVADLAKGGFAEARTAHSLLWYADYEKESGRARPEASLDHRTILVLDEAAMLDTRTLDRVVALAQKAGAKLILVGDDRQLASVERGGMFGVLRDELGSAELREVRRQHEDWQREASEALAGGRFLEAVKAYDERGFVHWSPNQAQAEDALIAQWRADTEDGIGERFVFAYTNADVDRLNAALQVEQVERGRITSLAPIATDRGELLVGQGDRVQFRATDKQRGIANGMLGTVAEVRDGRLRVTLDDGQEIEVDTAEYGGVDLGYAGTIYKGQGRTLDQAYVLHTEHWRDQASYVAMTRAREATHVFVAEDAARDVEELARQMGRRSSLGASLQYATEDEFENTNQGDAMTSRNDEALRKAQQQAEQQRQEAIAEEERQRREADEQEQAIRTELAEIEERRRQDAAREEDAKREAWLKEEQAREAQAAEEARRLLEANQAIAEGLAGDDAPAIEAVLRQYHDEQEQACAREIENDPVAGDPDALPANAGHRYMQAYAGHYDARSPYESLAKVALAEGLAYQAERQRLDRAIIAEPDEKRRAMLELRRDIEAADYQAGAWDRIAGTTGAMHGRDSEIYRSHKERHDHYREEARAGRREWIERAIDDPENYPALSRSMRQEIEKTRAERHAERPAPEMAEQQEQRARTTAEPERAVPDAGPAAGTGPAGGKSDEQEGLAKPIGPYRPMSREERERREREEAQRKQLERERGDDDYER